MKKLTRIEVAGILALCGDIHLVAMDADVHFYKTPSYHEGEVKEVHRVYCSAAVDYVYDPVYVVSIPSNRVLPSVSSIESY